MFFACTVTQVRQRLTARTCRNVECSLTGPMQSKTLLMLSIRRARYSPLLLDVGIYKFEI
jgi:hypothetical protein